MSTALAFMDASNSAAASAALRSSKAASTAARTSFSVLPTLARSSLATCPMLRKYAVKVPALPKTLTRTSSNFAVSCDSRTAFNVDSRNFCTSSIIDI